MNLQSERLYYEPLKLSDAGWFHYLNSDPCVRKYLWDDELISHEQVDEILQKNESSFAQSFWGLWKFRFLDSDEFIGYCGLWQFFDEDQPQLLYVLTPEYHHRGLATESARVVINYAFDILQFDHIIASVDDENSASVHVCQRLGMEFVREELKNGKPTLFFQLDSSKKLAPLF